MVNQNKIYYFQIKRQAKNGFSSDVERTVGEKRSLLFLAEERLSDWRCFIYYKSTLVISKSKGLSETLRDIRTSTYYICRRKE